LYLPQFLNREEARISHFFGYASPFNRLKPGVEFLMENRKDQRELLYKRYLQEWKRWKIKEIWLNLRKTIFLSSLEQQESNLPPADENNSENQTPWEALK